MTEKQMINAVFEGGGVKGIGLVGAVSVTEERGYQFANVAGTSAGAIISTLIAAGYSASELKAILDELDYNLFKDKGLVDKIPLVGSLASVAIEKGIYEGDFFLNWIQGLLDKKNVNTFGDLIVEENKDNPKYRYKLQVIAADVTRGKMLVLPRDIKEYGLDPDSLGIARAVRMSMSLPFFFEPVELEDSTGKKSIIVDGGLLSNYPVGIFDDEAEDALYPTIGYKLVEPGEGKPREIKSPISLLAALFSTMMEAHDAQYIRDSNFARTVPIKTLGIGTTDFDISRERSNDLFASGRKAASEFFDRWDYAKWKLKYLEKEPVGRRKRVLD